MSSCVSAASLSSSSSLSSFAQYRWRWARPTKRDCSGGRSVAVPSRAGSTVHLKCSNFDWLYGLSLCSSKIGNSRSQRGRSPYSQYCSQERKESKQEVQIASNSESDLIVISPNQLQGHWRALHMPPAQRELSGAGRAADTNACEDGWCCDDGANSPGSRKKVWDLTHSGLLFRTQWT